MACIPVYKGKRFPSTEKLLQYLSTEEGIMAHLADGKDTEFLKAIEGAVSAAEKSAAPTQQGNTEVGKIIGNQFRLLNEGKILDMDGNPIYDMTGGITTNGLENLTDKKYGHSSTRLNEEGSLDVLNNILSTGNMEGWFGTIGVEGAGPWTTGKFFIASNSIDGGSKGKIDPSEVEVILNVGLTPFAQELANKYPQTTIKDYNGNVYTPQKQSNAQQVTPTSTEGKTEVEGEDDQVVGEEKLSDVSIGKNGKYEENSILRYFADAFYTKRNGFNEFTKDELNGLTDKTKQYLIRVYNQLKNSFPDFHVTNGKEGYNKTLIDTDEKRIQFARAFLSFDPRREGSDNKINKIEYPSKEVLKNLDEVFGVESTNYNAEQPQSPAQQIAAPKPKPNPFIEKTRKAFNAALKKLGLKAKVKFISDEEAAEIVASGEPVKAMTAGFQTRDGKPIGFAYDTDEVARGRFDFSKLKKIGSGSDRDVYDLGDGKVLKVAKTARGLTQNIYEGDFYLKGIIPEVFERGLNYVVAENTPRMKAADVVETFDEDGNVIGKTSTGEMLRELQKFSQKDFDNRTSKLQDVLTKYGLQDIMSYEVLWPDFIAARNWGYKDGKAYHSDGGTFGGVDMIDSYKNKTNLSDPEFRKIYEESKRLKKQFGDTDKNTMYMREPSKMMIDGKEVTVQVINADVVNGFYSPLEKIINESKQDKMPAKQWAEKYANSEEAKWTGLKDWLANQTGAVSKADIQAYLKDNRIEVVEVVKGEGFEIEQSKLPKEAKIILEDYKSRYIELDDVIDKMSPLGYEVNSDYYGNITSISAKGRGITKFSEYQLPGDKKNYKEVLVTMPKKSAIDDDVISEYNKKLQTLKYGTKEYDAVMSEKQNYINSELQKYNKQVEFKSTHFDEPNILVHLRMNIRTDADGKKVLFLEEVQSDWGQKGKREGFGLSENDVKRLRELGYDYKDGKVGMNVYETFVPKNYNDLVGEAAQIARKAQLGVAAAPFVMDTNAWTKLGLKVALKEAVAQGADKIAWTTGEQQNDRYSLEKVADEVRYKKNEDGTYRIVAYKDGENVSENKRLPESKLEETLGKDVAKRIIDGVGEDIEGEKSLTGENLKVGGKGMKGFYGSPAERAKAPSLKIEKVGDKFKVGSKEFKNENEAKKYIDEYGLGIVGSVAKSLFKQEPGTISFDTGNAKIDAVRYDGSQDISDLPGNDMVENGDWLIKDTKGNFVFTFEGGLSKNEAINEFKEAAEDTGTQVSEGKGIQAQHSIDVTPELAAQATQGQPLFMKDSKGTILGFVQPQPDGSFKVWIDPATTNAETPIHELAGHIFMPLLKEAAPELHAKGVELIQGTPYQKNAEALGLEGAAASEEALAQAIGEKGKQLTESKRKDFLDWLNGMWKKIGEKLGITKPIKDLTLEEFTDLIAGSIVFGKQFEMKGEAGRDARAELKDNVGPEEFKRMEDIHRNGEKMLKELEGKGLIKIDCP